jgi:CBS domain-containing protein
MQVKTFMKTHVVTIAPGATLGEAWRLMAVERVAALPVVRGAALVGLFTDRDARRVAPSTVPALARYEAPRWLDRVHVADAMTRDVVTIRPDASVGEAVRLLVGSGLDTLPVVDEGVLVGLISARDLLAILPGMVEPGRPTGLGRILVPADFGESARHAVSTGAALARREGAALTLLHVLRPFGLAGLAAEGVPSGILARIAAIRRDEAAAELRRLLPPVDTVRVDVEITAGTPADAIIRVAARLDADLIVMGARRRGGLAAAVVREAPCPVLTVKAPRESVHACP